MKALNRSQWSLSLGRNQYLLPNQIADLTAEQVEEFKQYLEVLDEPKPEPKKQIKKVTPEKE